MSEIFRGAHDGFELVGLRNESVELALVPALGGKIVSLIDRHADRDWMWHPGEKLTLFGNATGDRFENSTMAGADECLPSVAACRVADRDIPDHGEVWSGKCEWREGEKGKEIAIAVSLRIVPLDLSRTIRLKNNVIEFRYELRNRSSEPQPYLWAFHPLMRIEEDDRIELDAEHIVVESTSASEQRGEKWAWPHPQTGADLSRLDLGGIGYAKCFLAPAGAGEVSIVNSGRRERITLAYDSPHISAVGIWLTRGGWNGYHHIAIEPTNAAADSLATAMAENLCQAIPARGSVEWSFRIIVGH